MKIEALSSPTPEQERRQRLGAQVDALSTRLERVGQELAARDPFKQEGGAGIMDAEQFNAQFGVEMQELAKHQETIRTLQRTLEQGWDTDKSEQLEAQAIEVETWLLSREATQARDNAWPNFYFGTESPAYAEQSTYPAPEPELREEEHLLPKQVVHNPHEVTAEYIKVGLAREALENTRDRYLTAYAKMLSEPKGPSDKTLQEYRDMEHALDRAEYRYEHFWLEHMQTNFPTYTKAPEIVATYRKAAERYMDVCRQDVRDSIDRTGKYVPGMAGRVATVVAAAAALTAAEMATQGLEEHTSSPQFDPAFSETQPPETSVEETEETTPVDEFAAFAPVDASVEIDDTASTAVSEGELPREIEATEPPTAEVVEATTEGRSAYDIYRDMIAQETNSPQE